MDAGVTQAGGVPSGVEQLGQHVRDLVKPRMRGVLHQWAALVAVVSGAALVAVAPGGRLRAAAAVYAVTVVALFATSATYHRVTWRRPRTRALMKRLDHSMIFVFIAGTYTPLCVALLHGTARVTLLITVWAGAVAGIVTRMLFLDAPRWLVIPLYIALGWVAVAVAPQILHGAGVAALVLIFVGGALYSLGAVAYATRRPDPVPAVFGYHEVFHLCTIVAALCHYAAVLIAVT